MKSNNLSIGKILLTNLAGVIFVVQIFILANVAKGQDAGTQSAIAQDEVIVSERSSRGLYKIFADVNYRADSYEWAIAFGSADPLSELEYSGISSVQVNLGADLALTHKVFLMPRVGFGKMLGGDGRDSDFSSGGSEISRFETDVEGETIDVALDLGYKFDFKNGNSIMPFIGIVYHRVNVTLKNGSLVVNRVDDSLDTFFGGLDSEDEAMWFGPRLGVQFDWNLSDKMSANLRAHLTYLQYDSDNYWNLRNLNFSNSGDGFGYGAELKLNYHFNNKYSLYLRGAYNGFSQVGSGTQDDRGADIELNDVKWSSFQAGLGIRVDF